MKPSTQATVSASPTVMGLGCARCGVQVLRPRHTPQCARSFPWPKGSGAKHVPRKMCSGTWIELKLRVVPDQAGASSGEG